MDLQLGTWDKLYRRDPKILAQIVEQGFVKGFSGIKEPYKLHIDEHQVAEAMSAEARTYNISFGWLAPLSRKNGKTEAVFATSKFKKILV